MERILLNKLALWGGTPVVVHSDATSGIDLQVGCGQRYRLK